MTIDYDALYQDKIVDLSGQLRNLPQRERARVYSTLKERNDILFLDLSNNRMQGERLKEEAFNFRTHFSYTRPDITYDSPQFRSILAEEAHEIAHIISNNKNLRGINLAGSDIREEGMKKILNAISNEHKRLKSINIENNNLFNPDEVLTNFLTQNSTVETFWYGDKAVLGSTTLGTANYDYNTKNDSEVLEKKFQDWLEKDLKNNDRHEYERRKNDHLRIVFEPFYGPNRSFAFDRNNIHQAIDQSPIQGMQVFDVEAGMGEFSQKSTKVRNQNVNTKKLKKIFDQYEEEIKNNIKIEESRLTPGSERLLFHS